MDAMFALNAEKAGSEARQTATTRVGPECLLTNSPKLLGMAFDFALNDVLCLLNDFIEFAASLRNARTLRHMNITMLQLYLSIFT